MALVLIEGFDSYGTTVANMSSKWSVSANILGSSYKRNGTYGACQYYYTMAYTKTLPSSSTYIVGAAYRIVTGSPSYNPSYPTMSFLNGGTTHVYLHVSNSGYFEFRNYNLDSLGISSSPIPTGSWFYLEAKCVINDTTGSVELRLNGSTILSASGLDTRNNNVDATITKIGIAGFASLTDVYLDDVYIDDSTFHGDCKVLTFFPDADGTYNNFSPTGQTDRHDCVNDTASDGDTDYVSSGTLNHLQTFGITAIPLSSVKGAMLTNILRKSDAGTIKIKNVVRSGGSDYLETDEYAVSDSYDGHSTMLATDPADSQPWTETKLNNAEFGVKITTA